MTNGGSNMHLLAELIAANEEWLMGRILHYAKLNGYVAYTSTLKEAWRLSISGLSGSITDYLATSTGPPELSPEEDLTQDGIAQFGIVEAQRHRERGVPLTMFLGLMKYYRQSYIDLVREQYLSDAETQRYELIINRVFDRIEIGFCQKWSGEDLEYSLRELQASNRLMTNEKNKYLTIFESIPNPVIILNKANKIDNMNLEAANLFSSDPIAGGQYYRADGRGRRETEICGGDAASDIDPSWFGGRNLSNVAPWIYSEVVGFQERNVSTADFEKEVTIKGQKLIFRVRLSKSLDISEKFGGLIIILEDITTLRTALNEVRTLRGYIPICASCKNIRDDKGYWLKVERYVAEHTDAVFSHGICPDCMKKLYPELNGKSDE